MSGTQTRYPTKDAHMGKQTSGSFSGWNGKDDHLIVGVIATGTYKYRSCIYFNIDFSPMLGIESATLTLYETNEAHTNQTNAPSEIIVARMTKDWGEGSSDPGEGNLTSTLSWDWNNRYDAYTSTGAVHKNITQGSSGDSNAIDVTDIVTAWFNGSTNYGFHIRNTEDEGSGDDQYGVEFWSRRSSGSSFRPKLEIVYTTNSPPSAPTLTSPVDAAITNTTVPTFQGTRVDSDSGDYITATQIQVSSPNHKRFKYSTTTTAADPGAGFFRINSPSSPSSLYISETDYDALSAVTFLTGTSGLFIRIHNTTGDAWIRATLGAATDNGTYRTIPLSSVGGSPLYAPSNNDIVVVEIGSTVDMDTGTTMWDSGTVTATGTPSTFSISYGSQGTATTLSASTFYKWRAKTRDSASEWSTGWSEWEYFKPNNVPNAPTVVIGESPTTDLPSITPTLSITHNDIDPADTKMYGYQVIVEKESSAGSGVWSTTGGWDSGQVDTSGSLATTKSVSSGSLDWGNSYRVRARTKDSAGAWSSYSSNQAFTTHKTGTPINLDPSGSESVSATPTFTGQRATSADIITAFTIQVLNADNSVKMAATRYTTGTDGDTFTKAYAGSALTAGNTYKWNVFVESAIGGSSATSTNQSFVVVDATTPTIVAPSGTGNTLTPTVTIDRATTFNRVQFEVYPSTSTSSALGTAHYASGTVSASIGAGGLGTRYSAAYAGTALVYATNYKMRARVSSDGGSNWSSWSGLSSFTTDSAGTPTLTTVGGVAQSGTPWITDSTPDFVITRAGSDTIDQMRVRVLNNTETVVIWDSTMTDVANATTGTLTYSGAALVPGTTYKWTASYKKSTGPTGPEATPQPFRLNAPPAAPTELYPPSGTAWNTLDIQYFRGTFVDQDITAMGDTPSRWEILVQEADGSPVYSQAVTSGLIVGNNETIWSGTALSTGVDYEWKSRFLDAKSEAGAYSGWNSFRISTAPNATDVIPTNGSNVNETTPTISWTYTGGTQRRFRVYVDRTDSDGVFMTGQSWVSPWQVTATTSYVLPAGHLTNGRYYNITILVENTDLLQDPSPPTVNVHVVMEAPDAITGLVATTDTQRSSVTLEWDETTIDTGTFDSYRVDKKLPNDDDWQDVGSSLSRTEPSYVDWYAGHGVTYMYRVVAVARVSGSLLESPDQEDGESITTVVIDLDDWIFIGEDRDDSHIRILVVDDEEHNRPVQQEAFEPLGANRKVIIRGFVLGNEGSLDTIWSNEDVPLFDDIQTFYNHTVIGRRIVDYLTFNQGPHILKSPFGDVWDAEFSAPTFNWQAGGHLFVNLQWIETGQTSQVSI